MQQMIRSRQSKASLDAWGAKHSIRQIGRTKFYASGTHLCNAGPVIVSQRAVCQNGVCHLGVGDQVDLQQLQAGMPRSKVQQPQAASTEGKGSWGAVACQSKVLQLKLLPS